MLIAIKFILFAVLICVSHGESQDVDPEYLSMLRATGEHEEYARLSGIDVNMIIPNEESEAGEHIRASPLGDIMFTAEEARQGTNFMRSPRSKWQNRVIPYTISSDFSPSERTYIEKYIDEFNKKVKNVKIIRHSGQRDYVEIISGNGCWSYLGKIGGRQLMSLNKEYCLYKSIIQHEFMHALGFVHEHTRSDRDRFVTVLTANIPPEWQPQYEKVNSYDYINPDKYDFYSIMHYGMRAPVTGKAAFQIRQSGVNQNNIGQREAMTDSDVRKVDAIYA